MTPFESWGYSPQDRFVVTGGISCEEGSIVQLDKDDGTPVPLFKLISGKICIPHNSGEKTVFIHVDNLKKIEEPSLKDPNQDVTITATAAEWAEVRLWLGASDSLSKLADKIFDLFPVDFDKVRCFRTRNDVPFRLRYRQIEDQWLELVFKKNEEKENEEELKRSLDSLEKEVENLRAKLKLN